MLVLAAALRSAPLVDTDPSTLVAGDTLEYQQLAMFFADPEGSTPPGNRFPGYPLFLLLLFTVLPWNPDVIQLSATVALSTAAVGLVFLLAARLAGRLTGLCVALLAAIQPDLVHNAHRGLSEELFVVGFLTMALLYLRALEASARSWRVHVTVGVVAGAVALIRPDAAYAAFPMATVCLWRGYRLGWPARLRTLPLLVLPILLPSMAQSWMESLGIQNMEMRAGRGILWIEFMLGRMPYSYMFYKETHVRDWLFQYHDLTELFVLGLKSSVRNALAMGEGLWSQLGMLLAMAGMVVHVRRTSDWAMPLAVPLAVLPQWGLVALWPEEDVFRYNLRVMPLLLLFLVVGAQAVAIRFEARVPGGMRKWLPLALLLGAMVPSLLPVSVFAAARPHVDVLAHERGVWLPKVSDTHERLKEIVLELRDGEDAAELAVPVRELIAHHDGYAPSYYTLGILHLPQKDLAGARENLERAVELVPFFAEAAALLAELYVVDGRSDEARELLDRVLRYRPDHPLLHLVSATLHLSAGNHADATAAYEEYLRLNRYQFDRALFREERIRKRLELEDDFVDSLRTETPDEVAGLSMPFTWSYLGLDLDGLELPRPQDETTYFNLGVCALYLDRAAEASRYFSAAVRIDSTDADAWHNLGRLSALIGRDDDARGYWRQALKMQTGHGLALTALRESLVGDTTPENDYYAPARIVLPLTGFRYNSGAG